MANQQGIMIIEKQFRTTYVLDVTIPNEGNIRIKEHEKLKKYLVFREELERVWRLKAAVSSEHSRQCPPDCRSGLLFQFYKLVVLVWSPKGESAFLQLYLVFFIFVNSLEICPS